MDKKKVDLKAVISGTGKAASDIIEKAKTNIVGTIDQNDDGKLDLSDVSFLASQWNEKKNMLKREAEKKTLCPIFEEDLGNPGFLMSKLIRVAAMDKKHAESEICKGSIGFESMQKDIRVVNIYPDKVDLFGLSFFPDMDSEIYYVDPSDRDHYIALDDYFNYLKVARVSELQRIAQDLGARYFRVTFKEQSKSHTGNSMKGKIGMKGAAKESADADFSHESDTRSFSKVEIAAEMECIGHKPTEPTLVYFKKDPQIQSLVSLRMADNAMTHQIYTLALSNSSGIKVKDAMKIDSALSMMRYSGEINVTNEAMSESCRYFEYEIDF